MPNLKYLDNLIQQAVTLSEEKGFGLDARNVTVEKFPLTVAPVSNVNLKRIE